MRAQRRVRQSGREFLAFLSWLSVVWAVCNTWLLPRWAWLSATPRPVPPSNSNTECDRGTRHYVALRQVMVSLRAHVADGTDSGLSTGTDVNDLEDRLLLLCNGTQRGQSVADGTATEIAATVQGLEFLSASGGHTPFSAEGNWNLAFSSAPIFIATPFYWIVGEFLRQIGGQGADDTVFRILTSLQEPLSAEWGAVVQTVDGDRLVSKVGLRVLGLLGTTLRSEVQLLQADSDHVVEVKAISSRVLDTWVPFLDQVAVPVDTILGLIATAFGKSASNGGAPRPKLQTTHVGPHIRVCRVSPGEGAAISSEFFVFQRATA